MQMSCQADGAIQEAVLSICLKFEEPEKGPYIELTWHKKEGTKATGELEDQITQATLHHIKNNLMDLDYFQLFLLDSSLPYC